MHHSCTIVCLSSFLKLLSSQDAPSLGLLWASIWDLYHTVAIYSISFSSCTTVSQTTYCIIHTLLQLCDTFTCSCDTVHSNTINNSGLLPCSILAIPINNMYIICVLPYKVHCVQWINNVLPFSQYCTSWHTKFALHTHYSTALTMSWLISN